jgi:hypothetical protein
LEKRARKTTSKTPENFICIVSDVVRHNAGLLIKKKLGGRPARLRQNFLYHFAMYVGEAEIAALVGEG